MIPQSASRQDIVERALARVQDFVTERVRNDGSHWTAVDHEDLARFYALVRELRDLKWDRGYEGDPSLEIVLVDRTRTQPLHHRPLPYPPDDPEGYLRVAADNARAAGEDLRDLDILLDRLIEDRERRAARAGG